MNTFTDQLAEWQVFYSTVALASVTLAGLLFVSLSINREVVRGSKDGLSLRLARESFGGFLYVLMIGLVFLVPHQVPIGLAVALFVLGLARGVGLVRRVIRTANDRSQEIKAGQTLREVALPALAVVGLLLVGIEVLRGDMVAIYGLVFVIAALLATARWNAWLLLTQEEMSVRTI